MNTQWSLCCLLLLAGSVSFAHTLTNAEKNQAWEQYKLGRSYEFAIASNASPAKAAECYRKAAEQGLAQAQYHLARLYFAGEGVRRDNKEALYWLHRAAEQRYSLAENRLGVIYERGEGVARDFIEAYKWYTLAADANNISASVNREHLAPRMSSRQIAEAQQRSVAARGQPPPNTPNEEFVIGNSPRHLK